MKIELGKRRVVLLYWFDVYTRAREQQNNLLIISSSKLYHLFVNKYNDPKSCRANKKLKCMKKECLRLLRDTMLTLSIDFISIVVSLRCLATIYYNKLPKDTRILHESQVLMCKIAMILCKITVITIKLTNKTQSLWLTSKLLADKHQFFDRTKNLISCQKSQELSFLLHSTWTFHTVRHDIAQYRTWHGSFLI